MNLMSNLISKQTYNDKILNTPNNNVGKKIKKKRMQNRQITNIDLGTPSAT